MEKENTKRANQIRALFFNIFKKKKDVIGKYIIALNFEKCPMLSIDIKYGNKIKANAAKILAQKFKPNSFNNNKNPIKPIR